MKHTINDRIEFFVSPEGDDAWSGALPSPNRSGTDGPFAGLKAAQRVARRLRDRKGVKKPVFIVLRGGVYFLKAPLVLRPEDSGSPKQGALTRNADDPKFRDPENGDFHLDKDSPAFRIGFAPFDLSAVGPRRPPSSRKCAASLRKRCDDNI